MPSIPIALEFSIHNARCQLHLLLSLFTLRQASCSRSQIQELKLRAEEQTSIEEHHIAALTGIILPKRAARIKTVPSLVSGLRHRNDDPSIDSTVLEVFQILTRHLDEYSYQEAVAGVFDSVLVLRAMVQQMKAISNQLSIPWQFDREIPGSEVG
jgi:hypothetical protein